MKIIKMKMMFLNQLKLKAIEIKKNKQTIKN